MSSALRTPRRNILLALLISALRTGALLCATGALMQTFLSSIGLSEGWIYIFVTVQSAVNVSTILLFSRFADGKHVFLRCFFANAVAGGFSLAFVPFCFFSEVDVGGFAVLLGIAGLQSAAIALNTVCDYKIPYFIYTAEQYGFVSAMMGILGSFVSLGAAELVAYLQTLFAYVDIMKIAFAVAGVFLAFSGVFTLLYVNMAKGETTPEEEEKTEKVPIRSVIAHPAFSGLVVPNLLRGFASGITLAMAVVALSLGRTEAFTVRLVSIAAVATLLSNFAFGLLSRLLSPRALILLGCLPYLVLPLFMVENELLAFGVYALVCFGRTFVDVGVPTVCRYAVPVKIAGPYNALRMVLHTGGGMIATALAAVLPVVPLIVLTAVTGITSGVIYFVLPVLRRAAPGILLRKKK